MQKSCPDAHPYTAKLPNVRVDMYPPLSIFLSSNDENDDDGEDEEAKTDSSNDYIGENLNSPCLLLDGSWSQSCQAYSLLLVG